MKTRKRILIILCFLVLTVILASCGASMADYEQVTSRQQVVEVEVQAEPLALEEEPPLLEPEDIVGESSNTSNLPPDMQRLVIMDTDMSIVAVNPAEVLDTVAEMAQAYGGYVVSSNLRQKYGADGMEYPHATITVRVPYKRLQQTLEEIEHLAVEVLSKNQSGQDVTNKYTDLQSRLRNLEDAAEQLRQIMDQTVNTDEVLKVYEELIEVTEETEVVKGQIQYFEQASALSSISLIIQAQMPPTPTPTATPTPTPTPTPQPWSPGPAFKDSSKNLVNFLRGFINFLIWLIIYALPVLALIAAPFLLGWWVLRKVRKPKKATPKKKKSDE